MENNWLSLAKRLQAIASTGNAYTKDEFDRERYDEVSEIALQMLSDISKKPIEVIANVLDEGTRGYATPKVEVRAAVFNGDRILLVQEKSDGLWTFPGGFADLGLSPAENIEKEVLEEASLDVSATHLYCLRHKAKGDYDPDVRDFYKLFFLCQPAGEKGVAPGAETCGAAYFKLDELPPLSKGRIVEDDVLAAFKFRANTSQATLFD
jgi:ADP-ribose pyrophosphatase YjhB (NUDIX family)